VRVNVPLPFSAVPPPDEQNSMRCLPWGKMGGEGENSPGEVSIRARSYRGIRLLTGCSPFGPEVVFDGQLQLAELHRLLVAGMGTGFVEFEHSG